MNAIVRNETSNAVTIRRAPGRTAKGGNHRDLPFGLALTIAIAALAFALRHLPGLTAMSPTILAIVLGMAFHNLVGTPARAKAGVAFSMRKVLRFAIILLGLR